LPWSDETTYYGAQISALTVSPNRDYDSGTVIVNVGPGKKAGEKGIITLKPKTRYIQVINKTVTVSERSKPTDINVEREHGTNQVIVEGQVAVDAHKKNYWISVWEPTKYVLSLFEKSLKEQGIQLLGDIKTGETPARATTLATHLSMPLSQLLIPFMKLSNNGHAEVLVKEMGRIEQGEGSWDKGLEVMQNELLNMGIDVDRFVIRDGSGVSHINLVTANEISKLLYITRGKEWFPSFVRSLPVAGADRKMGSGTLGNRMKELAKKANIKAKTGTITSVSSLSGYIEKEGGDIIFSILLNNLNADQKGKEVEDKIVEILATF
jgi:D-alanyl-D-alanine carboxypeptidase/D-alanyl-D-alanine-endopeptidase (penicillin-binding protein 4)